MSVIQVRPCCSLKQRCIVYVYVRPSGARMGREGVWHPVLNPVWWDSSVTRFYPLLRNHASPSLPFCPSVPLSLSSIWSCFVQLSLTLFLRTNVISLSLSAALCLSGPAGPHSNSNLRFDSSHGVQDKSCLCTLFSRVRGVICQSVKRDNGWCDSVYMVVWFSLSSSHLKPDMHKYPSHICTNTHISCQSPLGHYRMHVYVRPASTCVCMYVCLISISPDHPPPPMHNYIKNNKVNDCLALYLYHPRLRSPNPTDTLPGVVLH